MWEKVIGGMRPNEDLPGWTDISLAASADGISTRKVRVTIETKRLQIPGTYRRVLDQMVADLEIAR